MRRIYILFILGLITLFPVSTKADHLFGAELTYQHVSGLTYRIVLSLYGDCSSLNAAFDSLPTNQPVVRVLLGQTEHQTLFLLPDASQSEEITPVCDALQNSTSCSDPGSSIPGVKKFVYSAVCELSGTSPGWRFIFDGSFRDYPGAGTVRAGRSSSISNIVQAGGASLIYLEATLNNTAGANTSPEFTTIPTPFFCVDTDQEFNHGAVDSDNDSLGYLMVPALSNGQPVTYANGHSATYPISTASGSFGFNPLNGQMSFTPDLVQKGVVVNRVNEYRNGVLIGSVMREMTFVILGNCQNNTSADSIGQVINALVDSNRVINVCQGTSSIGFTIQYNDTDGDILNLSYTGLPSNAQLIVNNNNSPAPSLVFTWNTSSVPPGVYNIYVTVEEDNCPISSRRTNSYTIRVAPPPQINAEILSATNCFSDAGVAYFIQGGVEPYVIEVRENGQLIRTITSNHTNVIDSLPAGSYTISLSTPKLSCPGITTEVTIVDSGIYPFGPSLDQPPVFCIGDPARQLHAIPAPGAVVSWFDIEGNLLPAAPYIVPENAGTSYYLVSQQKDNCVSEKDTVTVIVSDFPQISIPIQSGAVCMGEVIFLQATGAGQLTWYPENAIFSDPQGLYVRVFEPAQYTVVGSNQYGCKDTAVLAFTQVDPCCTFSIPNAFSPNGDNRNDTWHPVLYGNERFYELVIFNRWGNELFHSFRADDGWDGTWNGKPQENGAYFYYLKATCVTGRQETAKGEFYLLR